MEHFLVDTIFHQVILLSNNRYVIVDIQHILRRFIYIEVI